MSVGYWDAQTLGGDGGAIRLDKFIVLDASPDLQRLLLALFLLATDIRDQVIDHFGPTFKGLAGARDGLIGTDQDLFHTVLQQGGDGGSIRLDRAVGLAFGT